MWMSLKTHNMPSGHLKKRLWLSRWSDFPFEFILCIRGIEKRDFFESLKLCSKYVYDLWNKNLACGRVLKRILWSPWSDVSRCQKEIRNNFCIQGIEKSTWSKSFKSCLSRRMALRTHNITSGCLKKMTLLMSLKQCLKVSKGHAMSYTSLWALKRVLFKSHKWCFN
jgi:hypothetical protein